jgi:hypothetical protein
MVVVIVSALDKNSRGYQAKEAFALLGRIHKPRASIVGLT